MQRSNLKTFHGRYLPFPAQGVGEVIRDHRRTVAISGIIRLKSLRVRDHLLAFRYQKQEFPSKMEFRAAVERGDCLTLARGTHHMGKRCSSRRQNRVFACRAWMKWIAWLRILTQ